MNIQKIKPVQFIETKMKEKYPYPHKLSTNIKCHD